MTARMLAAIEEILMDEHPDAVMVYGDTNSTLSGALAAAKLVIPLIHVEAGLRSFNRRMPEEINRVVTDHLSDVLLCPTLRAVTNLAAEGIQRGVHHVGDVMYDTTVVTIPLAKSHSSIMKRLNLTDKSYAVATVHRAENTDDAAALGNVTNYLGEQARLQPVVWPVHPRTRVAAAKFNIELERPGITLIEPVGFLDMCLLLNRASAIFTDSGGIQKEAYFHRVPCVTLRNETEWVETITHGWNRLWSRAGYQPRSEIAEYGDGHAAERMLRVILDLPRADPSGSFAGNKP
jgi:UDP-GlcNAc3NAcA epimerase